MSANIRLSSVSFRPGEEIPGSVSWSLPKTPREVELRFFWQTQGKGDRDVEVVATERFDRPQPADAREFRFVAPPFPPSFSGRLISLVWAVELVADGEPLGAEELVIGPSGQEIQLERPDWLQGDEMPKVGSIRGRS